MRGPCVLVIAAVALACGLWGGCESEPPNAPERVPATVDEFFKALDSGLSAETGLFHLQLTYDQTEHGQTQSWGTVEAWIDASNERARWEFTKSADNQADIAGHTVSIYTTGALYRLNLEIDGEKVQRLDPPDIQPCFPEAPNYILGLVACGILPDDMSGWSLSVEPSTFEGVATYSLLFEKPAEPPRVPEGVPPPPGGWPTPDPIVVAAKQAQVRFHIDAKTHLPLAVVQLLDSDPDRTTTGGLIRFNGSFVPENELPAGGFRLAPWGTFHPTRKSAGNSNAPTSKRPFTGSAARSIPAEAYPCSATFTWRATARVPQAEMSRTSRSNSPTAARPAV